MRALKNALLTFFEECEATILAGKYVGGARRDLNLLL
jgi:hypothetical protein